MLTRLFKMYTGNIVVRAITVIFKLSAVFKYNCTLFVLFLVSTAYKVVWWKQIPVE